MSNDGVLVRLSLEDFPNFIHDDDPELAIARTLFLSTRPNSQKFTLSEEVLRKWSKTILGKFLVGNLNYFESDVLSHEKEPDIFGYIPTNQNVEFVRADDGYLDAYVNVVISKIYATKVYQLFTRENFRNVSVEMRVLYENEETKEVAEFHIAGLTVLGIGIEPAVPHANIQMVRFSKDNTETIENFYKLSCDADNANDLQNDITEVLTKLTSIKNKLKSTNMEGMMAKKKDEKDENVIMSEETKKPTEKEKEVEKEQADGEKDKAEPKKDEAEQVKESKDEAEKVKESEDEKKDIEKSKDAEKEEADKAKDNKEEEVKEAKENGKDEKDTKLAEMETKCSDLEAKLAKANDELEKLRKFKAETEENQKCAIVNQTLSQVKDSVEEKAYAKFEADAKNYDFSNINTWKNEVLANVATVLMSKETDNKGYKRMGMSDENDAPKSLWDRI